MQKLLVVFDLDGTLVNSLPDIAAVYNKVLSDNGFATHALDDYRSFVGWGLARALELAISRPIDDQLKQSMLSEIVAIYSADPVSRSTVYPGVGELVAVLREHGARIGVITNKNEVIALQIVNHLFPPGTFDFVLGGKSGVPKKPDPSALIDYLKVYKNQHSSILYVGDTPIDYQTALGAGFPFAGVTWGFRDRSVLEDAGSDSNFDTAAELRQWIYEKWRET